MRSRSWARYAICVAAVHALGGVLLAVALPHHPAVLGMAFLAYTFGLRHAFDVDHIAAIDNTVRKLMSQRTSPLGVGFYFSLGHSTVVACMALLTAVAVHFAQHAMPGLQRLGGIVGTAVSGVFLVVIGIINVVILCDVFRLFIRMRDREHDEHEVEHLLSSGGFVSRFVRPLFRFVNRSWHVYPIGFLFGLGFDTASEVALLAVAAVAAKNAIPMAGILSLPILFAAGMSLMDTADGIFMTSAYRWAFSTPVRKVYYNLSITGLGVAAALVIGLMEIGQVIVPELGLRGPFWTWLSAVNFSSLGYVLVVLFVIMWLLSYGIWKLFRIEERWTRSAAGE